MHCMHHLVWKAPYGWRPLASISGFTTEFGIRMCIRMLYVFDICIWLAGTDGITLRASSFCGWFMWCV